MPEENRGPWSKKFENRCLNHWFDTVLLYVILNVCRPGSEKPPAQFFDELTAVGDIGLQCMFGCSSSSSNCKSAEFSLKAMTRVRGGFTRNLPNSSYFSSVRGGGSYPYVSWRVNPPSPPDIQHCTVSYSWVLVLCVIGTRVSWLLLPTIVFFLYWKFSRMATVSESDIYIWTAGYWQLVTDDCSTSCDWWTPRDTRAQKASTEQMKVSGIATYKLA